MSELSEQIIATEKRVGFLERMLGEALELLEKALVTGTKQDIACSSLMRRGDLVLTVFDKGNLERVVEICSDALGKDKSDD